MPSKCFLVFSDDFGEHPSSCQHLFRFMPQKHLVLWVNTIGMRNPRLTLGDFKKVLIKSSNMLSVGGKKKKEIVSTSNIKVCQPPMLPFLNFPLIRAFNKKSLKKHVREKMALLNMEAPICVITAINACDYIGLFNECRVVYYCVDDFSEWPGLDKKLVQSMEKELLGKADVLVATSDELYRRLSSTGKEIHLLTHGVDYEFFKKKVDQEHPLLKDIPKPRIGYFGLFDKRSDQELIAAVAERMPDFSFVITGNVEVNTTRLKAKKNIYFTGSIPYRELPAMASGWDICILPYKINKLTDAIQPLKLKEYLSTGIPVISAPIKESVKLGMYLSIAKTPQEWEEKIKGNIKSRSVKQKNKIQSFLEKESWNSKAELFFNICLKGSMIK
jgi:glycosyltransferase involved in cell wall biosynthesis